MVLRNLRTAFAASLGSRENGVLSRLAELDMRDVRARVEIALVPPACYYESTNFGQDLTYCNEKLPLLMTIVDANEKRWRIPMAWPNSMEELQPRLPIRGLLFSPICVLR